VEVVRRYSNHPELHDTLTDLLGHK